MKRIFLSLMILLMSFAVMAQSKQSLTGAYLAKDGNVNHLWLFVDGYSSYIQYEDNKYLSTWGGPFSEGTNGIQVQLEYNDAKPDEIGKAKETNAKANADGITMGNLNFKKQVANKQDLDGLWRITGRKQDNKMSEIPRGDRKTIKILVDGYFQWIAINPAEKGFYGTGGGTYTFTNKKYTEKILFFSRDNSRVGAELSFDGEIKDAQWHHSGLSSKGDPNYEIWSRGDGH
jgi:hypothetical protein